MSKFYPSSADPVDAYLYVRFSTAEQAHGNSLQRQLDLGSRYAAEHGLNLPTENVIIDSGISAYTGANVDTGKFGSNFIEKLEKGQIKPGSVLLVETIDRISRQSGIDASLLILGILKKKVRIVTLFDGKMLSAENFGLEPMLNLNLKIAGSNDESLKKEIRLTHVWQHKRDQAGVKKLTSLCPSWLQLNPDRASFSLVPENVATVKRIFREALNGAGAHAIASRLNRDKVPTFGSSKGWPKSTINKILTNRAVIGDFQPCTKKSKQRRIAVGNPVPGYFPAIISEDEFIRVQQGRRSRTVSGMGRKGESYNNIFSKRAICGHCGEAMHYINKGPGPKGGSYLACSGSRRFQCSAKPWKYDLFERAFLNHVKELDLTSLFSGGNSEIESMRDLIDAKNGEIHNLDRQMRKVLDLLAGPNPDDEYIAKFYSELSAKAKLATKTRDELIKRCEELKIQSLAASEMDLLKLLKDIATRDDDQFLKRAKIAHRIRVLIEHIRVFPQTDDKHVILNWANKRVDEVKLGEASKKTQDALIPMFDVEFPNGVTNRFSIISPR